MENQICGVSIEEFVILKPKIYLLLVYYKVEYKKTKDRYKNVVERITQYVE